LTPGLETGFDATDRRAPLLRDLTFNRAFFDHLANSIELAKTVSTPIESDGTEYEAEEADLAAMARLAEEMGDPRRQIAVVTRRVTLAYLVGRAAEVRGAAEDAGEDADQGDADLHRGQEGLRIVDQPPRQGRAREALALQDREPGPAGRDQGELAHREQPVHPDQDQDGQNFETEIHRTAAVAQRLARVRFI